MSLFEKFKSHELSKGKCKKCSQIYTYEHGNSNMRKHMLRHGQNVAGDELENAPFDQNFYHDSMGKAIVKHNLPFSYV